MLQRGSVCTNDRSGERTKIEMLRHNWKTSVFFVFAFITSLSSQNNPGQRPWMNPNLSPDDRAEMVLKQLTLDEKISLLHGNGMAHAPQWQMPLTYLSNGGAGYVEGIPRLGIPPLYISDAAYGVRSSGENGRYSTALPSNLGAASS
jgi:beta-glucosidase-like glycosyl hydrolase